MADREKSVPSQSEKTDQKSEENDDDGDAKVNNSLEDFVTEHYNQQKGDGRMAVTEEIGEERTANFFARAISESRRMNKEIKKSQNKLDALHTEFGMELVDSWRKEHASEVLQPHEAELVKVSQYK